MPLIYKAILAPNTLSDKAAKSEKRTEIPPCENRINPLKYLLMIDKNLIQNRMNFWGYGSFEAPVWFVGMEEGLAATEESELEERFRITYGKITTDIRRGMETVPLHILALEGYQPLWDFQIALYLYLKNGGEAKPEERHNYQTHSFGNIDLKETACIDLMPLPSRGTAESDWVYAKYATENLKFESRSIYIKHYKPARVQELKKLIKQYRPNLVIFCSLVYLRTGDWGSIIGKNLEEITNQMYFAKTEETSFCVIPQPGYLLRQHLTRAQAYKRLYEFADKIKDKIEAF